MTLYTLRDTPQDFPNLRCTRQRESESESARESEGDREMMREGKVLGLYPSLQPSGCRQHMCVCVHIFRQHMHVCVRIHLGKGSSMSQPRRTGFKTGRLSSAPGAAGTAAARLCWSRCRASQGAGDAASAGRAAGCHGLGAEHAARHVCAPAMSQSASRGVGAVGPALGVRPRRRSPYTLSAWRLLEAAPHECRLARRSCCALGA